MPVVGLTGGIASGKSTVAELFRRKGAVVLDADAIAKQVMAPGGPAYPAVVERFGSEVLSGSGEINRAGLAGLVFSDPAARKDLEEITHPEIFRRLAQEVKMCPREKIVVVEAALLIETLDRWRGGLGLDAVVLVLGPREDQLQRLVGRRGLDEASALARIDAQGSWDAKAQLADYVIDNTGSVQDLEKAAANVWDKLTARLGQ